MKNRLVTFATLALTLLSANAQQKYEIGNPNDANYDYLKDYRPLKEYINKEKYPNFRLGIGTTVNDYLNANTLVGGLTNDNFTETVAGNAMKMASCVDSNGNMNFSTVTRYVNAATEAGLDVYGHTLAWHSQQANAWLRSLIKDKVVSADGNTPSGYVPVVTKDFTKKSDQTIGWSSSMEDNGFSVTFSSTDGMKIHTTKKCTNFWDVQFLAITGLSIDKGVNYKVTMQVRATDAGNFHTKLGSWSDGIMPNVPFTTEWKDVEINYDNAKGGDFYMLQCGDFVGDIFVRSITISEEAAGERVPLTQAEKLEALTGAMDKWIKGMMEACDGKVKAWDVVNEAIGGNGNDKDSDGNYNLQHSVGYVPGATKWDVGGDAFFWQDHMGDLDYVRTAVRLARKYGPKDIKLFINDYNLESTWDDNHKLKSLINWIRKWEADGVTKIDGIGTQMHINYYRDAAMQDSQKKHIKKMFELMAASGKLVRVSEFDMGIRQSNINGPAILTSKTTEEDHKAMADYYQWIVKTYLETIPPAQQWGICFWCPTDAPDGQYVWRANEPVGIWTLDFYRKHAYAGIVRGLGGVPSDLGHVEAEQSSDAIFDLHGNRINGTLQSLPAGIYVVGGRKVVK